MIIIDEDKYEKLLKTVAVYEVSKELVPDEDSLSLYKDIILGKYLTQIETVLGVKLSNEQVIISKTIGFLPTNSMTHCVAFKPNKQQIALWDSIEEIIELQPDFRPPLLIRTQREVNWAETSDTVVPYDELRYWPWGYDLERNVQVWKKR